MRQWAKNFYSKNIQWLQWVGVAGMPVVWTIIFYWIVFGKGLPTQRDFVSGWMESKFTMYSIIKGVLILVVTMVIWKFKVIRKFPPIFMKLAAGSLFGAIIGTYFASAIWNYGIHQYQDANIFTGVGIVTWLCYLGVINILNRQKP